jgi:hypothetical protein
MTQSRSRSVTFRFPTEEYRSLPFPRGTARESSRAKLATCFIRVEELPDGLENWMQVNPRVPKRDTKHKLRGPVARAMVDTLRDEPDKFVLKNQGIYILAKDVSFQKEEGGCGVVSIILEDPAAHGLVNGGHSYLAIRQAKDERECNGDGGEPWDAYVRLHLMEGIDQEDITELAEGLNRSMQVDDPSLENLKGSFDRIKQELEGKPGANAVAYRQGDTGDIDVQQILSYMALFDLEQYPDRKTHPYKVFGHPKAVLQYFIDDTNPENGDSARVFDRLLPKVHEVLVLADRIQQEAVSRLGRLKVKSAKGDNRVRSPRHRNRPAPFAGGTIDGLIHLGWLYPMLGAFRANVSREAWAEGRLEWIGDPEELLGAVIDEMTAVVKQDHQDNKGKPAEVGRKEAAYRMCYGILTVELAQRGLLTLNA